MSDNNCRLLPDLYDEMTTLSGVHILIYHFAQSITHLSSFFLQKTSYLTFKNSI